MDDNGLSPDDSCIVGVQVDEIVALDLPASQR
jgi:hypothetical protein